MVRARMLFFFCLCWAAVALAAETGLKSRVVDNYGTGLPGVTIAVEGPVSRSVLSQVEGRYRLPNLLAGAYTVTARMPGFVTVEGETHS